MNLAGLDYQVDLIVGHDTRVALGDAAHLDGRRADGLGGYVDYRRVD